LSVSRIAFVESRSWTNRGSVGTSKESRSAFPAQSRNGLLIALSLEMEAFPALHSDHPTATQEKANCRSEMSLRADVS
jgi:hypothetical protein